MAFGINYEGTFEQQYKYHRLYLAAKEKILIVTSSPELYKVY